MMKRACSAAFLLAVASALVFQLHVVLDSAFHRYSKDGIRDYRTGQLLGTRVHVDPRTGLRVSERKRRAVEDWARRGALPPRDRWWRSDEPVPVVR